MNDRMTDQIVFRISKEEKEMIVNYCKKLRLKPGTFIRNLLVTTVEKELEKEKEEK